MTALQQKLTDFNLLIDGAFLMDNSRMENILQCKRKGLMSVCFKRKPSDVSMALNFGTAIHEALCFRYRHYPLQPSPEQLHDCTLRQHILLELFYKTLQVPFGDHRSIDFAKDTITAYNNTYSREDFTIITSDDTPIVEQGFAIQLGVVEDIPIIWTGRLDLGIQQDGKIAVLDHKTASVGGDSYFDQYHLSGQMLGYCAALTEILKQPVFKVLIDALIVRKPSRTGKGTEFLRGVINYEPALVEEWRLDMLNNLADFFHCIERDYFPAQLTSCQGKFGRCPYLDVCRMDPANRGQYLSTNAFTDDKWDPLHDVGIDHAAILAAPLTSQELPTGMSHIPTIDL